MTTQSSSPGGSDAASGSGATGTSGASGAPGATGTSGASGAPGAPGASGTSTAGSATAAPGPVSILTCTNCGKKNKIRPSEKGAPHCGSCGTILPWLVNATDETFDREAKASMAVVVDLWAPWCGPCRFVSPILEQLAAEFPGRLKVVKVNVDDNPKLARQFQATSIPTMVVLRNGRVVDRIVGAMQKTDLTVRLTPFLMRT